MRQSNQKADRLAALLLAAGFFNALAQQPSAAGNTWERSLKAVDRSPLVLISAKSMACGKCATQGQCGETYWDKLKHRKHTGASGTRSIKKRGTR